MTPGEAPFRGGSLPLVAAGDFRHPPNNGRIHLAFLLFALFQAGNIRLSLVAPGPVDQAPGHSGRGFVRCRLCCSGKNRGEEQQAAQQYGMQAMYEARYFPRAVSVFFPCVHGLLHSCLHGFTFAGQNPGPA